MLSSTELAGRCAGVGNSSGIQGGFLQIYNNTVTLLTDWARLTEGGLEEARVAAAELRAEVEQDEAEA